MIEMLLAEGALADASPAGPAVRRDADPPRHAARPRSSGCPTRACCRSSGRPRPARSLPQSRGSRARRRPIGPTCCCRSAGRSAAPSCGSSTPTTRASARSPSRAPHVFQVDDDGWRRTGDLGVISDEGYVLAARSRQRPHHPGRREHLPDRDRARPARTHPGVREVAVVGVARPQVGRDREGGRRAGRSAGSARRRRSAGVRRRPAGPLQGARRSSSSSTELPRNPSGKILRRELAIARTARGDDSWASRLTDADEGVHAPGDQINWNESRYIDFWDPQRTRRRLVPHRGPAECALRRDVGVSCSCPTAASRSPSTAPRSTATVSPPAGQTWEIVEPWRTTPRRLRRGDVAVRRPVGAHQPEAGVRSEPRASTSRSRSSARPRVSAPTMGQDQDQHHLIFLPGPGRLPLPAHGPRDRHGPRR